MGLLHDQLIKAAIRELVQGSGSAGPEGVEDRLPSGTNKGGLFHRRGATALMNLESCLRPRPHRGQSSMTFMTVTAGGALVSQLVSMVALLLF